MRYSALSLLLNGITRNKFWKPTWRKAKLKDSYEVIIVGGGGHGLATAYYLAKNHGIKNIAVIDRGYLGNGNVGRNTTIIRANYQESGNQPFYEFSLKLWESFEQDIKYNAMVSQRGVLNLLHSPAQIDAATRRGNSMMLTQSNAELLDVEAIRAIYPNLDFDNARFPIKAGLLHNRGGTVRHDAVAWGYARAADKLGVDIIENCEVLDFLIEDGQCNGVITLQKPVTAKKVAVCVAGSSSELMNLAGISLPIETHVLQAFVTEGLKPLLPSVITYGAGHFYISQSNKGGLVFGGDIDGYNSYAQRGNLPTTENVCECAVAMMPSLSNAKVLRSWGGSVDMSMDGSAFIDKTNIEGLYFNGGWCYGGFKATPASGYCYAHLIANQKHHPVANEYRLDRFIKGRVIDERGSGAQPNLH